MENAIKKILKELKEIRVDIEFIKQHIADTNSNLTLEEETELSEEAKKVLEEERDTPEEEYIDLENV